MEFFNYMAEFVIRDMVESLIAETDDATIIRTIHNAHAIKQFLYMMQSEASSIVPRHSESQQRDTHYE